MVGIESTAREWRVNLEVDGEWVSGLSIVDRQIRAGLTRLKMAGIAGVWTHDDHRKKGYASKVMWAAIEEMTRRRYDVSVLFGIPDFYDRYGYAVAFASPVCDVETDALPSRARGFSVRAARKSDLDHIVRIYARCNRHRVASAIRRKGWFPGFREHLGFYSPRLTAGVDKRPGRAVVVTNQSGRTVAYAVLDAREGHCSVTEVGGERGAFPALAARIRKAAAGAKAPRVRLHLPVDDPFGEYLRRFGATWHIHYPSNSGAMFRVVTLEPALAKLCPTFTDRLKKAGVSIPKQGICFDTDLGTATVRSVRGKATVSVEPAGSKVGISQFHLSQLITGYRSVDDLAIEQNITCASSVMPTLTAMFPREAPYMWWGDRF